MCFYFLNKPQQPKTMPPPDVPNYENLQKFQKPAAAEVDLKQWAAVFIKVA